MQERFDKVLSNTENQGAIPLHPHFRFSPMSEADNQLFQFNSESIYKKIKAKLIGLVKSLLNEEDLCPTSSSHETEAAAKQDDFLFEQSKDGKQIAPQLVKGFLDASPQRHVNASCFRYEALKRGFIRMNTIIPSSDAVERVLSIGKDVLKPKRSRLSDIRFEMFIFLKANKWNHRLCYYIFFSMKTKTAKFCNFLWCDSKDN